MNTFPNLRTGAITQYPAERSYVFSTQVIRFVDGSEQRFRDYPSPLHRWIVRLDRLDESELNRLREFVRIQDGAAQPFAFTDPQDGMLYPSCRLDGDEFTDELLNAGRIRTALTIVENRI